LYKTKIYHIFVTGIKKVFNAMRQTLIKKLQNFFSAYLVEKAWVFGSYAHLPDNP
jgi:hypothetical protein